jgi:hypothetical protein
VLLFVAGDFLNDFHAATESLEKLAVGTVDLASKLCQLCV